jgi:NitT/TauT family transport system permease protein
MTLEAAAGAEDGKEQGLPSLARKSHAPASGLLGSVGLAALGIGGLFLLWGLGGWLIANNSDTASFAGFAPAPALKSLVALFVSGDAWRITAPSLWRVGSGLLWATALGVPLGILIGRSPLARSITNVPFQFLRMISPLSWMPIAILAFSTWEGAIVFLITAAAIWPILFSTAAGVRRIDPAWFKVARNLGANAFHLLTTVILPAIAQDILTGIRLALGVGWIVLVPAEYLGVKSGLGYAINDARDTLEYDRLAAVVLIIGLIGFALDATLQRLIQRLSWLRQDH